MALRGVGASDRQKGWRLQERKKKFTSRRSKWPCPPWALAGGSPGVEEMQTAPSQSRWPLEPETRTLLPKIAHPKCGRPPPDFPRSSLGMNEGGKHGPGPLPSTQRLTPAWETTGNAPPVCPSRGFSHCSLPTSHSGTGSWRWSLRTTAHTSLSM